MVETLTCDISAVRHRYKGDIYFLKPQRSYVMIMLLIMVLVVVFVMILVLGDNNFLMFGVCVCVFSYSSFSSHNNSMRKVV